MTDEREGLGLAGEAVARSKQISIRPPGSGGRADHLEVTVKTCSVEGCDKPVVARGLCQRDYTRWQRHGDPTVVKPTQERPPCGTYGGYQSHHRRNEKACDPCKAAFAAGIKDYRSDPVVKARNTHRQKIHARAMRQLAREYPARFLELVDQFKAAT